MIGKSTQSCNQVRVSTLKLLLDIWEIGTVLNVSYKTSLLPHTRYYYTLVNCSKIDETQIANIYQRLLQ